MRETISGSGKASSTGISCAGQLVRRSLGLVCSFYSCYPEILHELVISHTSQVLCGDIVHRSENTSHSERRMRLRPISSL